MIRIASSEIGSLVRQCAEAFEQISRKMPFTAYPALYRVIAEEQKPPSL